jgi:hypothetical protein
MYFVLRTIFILVYGMKNAPNSTSVGGPCLLRILTFLYICCVRCAISNGAGGIGTPILLAQGGSVSQ